MPRKPLKPLQKKIQRPEKWIIDFFIKGYTPEKLHYSFDVWCIEFNHKNQAVDIWKEHGEWVLSNYIRKHPGKRPAYLWKQDAPRLEKKFNAWYDGKLPEPRERLGGIGTPQYECLAVVPTFTFGIPDIWVSKSQEDYYNGRFKSKDPWMQGEYEKNGYKEGHFKGVAIDPENLPTFESQASYLKRHNLLKKSEERRLKPADFEPENCLKYVKNT